MRRLLLIVSFCLFLPAFAAAQVREALVIFKDGYSIKGKIIQQKDIILDPSGASIVIAKDGSFLYLDDDVRKITFSPYQVQEVIPSKQGETRRDLITIHKQNPTNRKDMILPGWMFEKYSPWNDKWERTISVKTPTGKFEMTERIIHMTPWQTYIMNTRYSADQLYLTKELGPEFVLGLVSKHFAGQKDMKELDRRLQIARFAQQAGWNAVALVELEKLVKEYPDAKESAKPFIDQLKTLRATMFVDDIERTHRIGQHEEAQARIAAFYQDYLVKEAGAKQQIIVQDYQTKYETAKEKLQQTKQYLKEFPAKVNPAVRPFWTIAAATIVEELTIDTLPRLDTFITFAQQHQRALKEKCKPPAQTTEELLALAISGWLQGNTLADPDVRHATKLFKARLMLQEYVKTDGSVARGKLATGFSKDQELPVDVMARMVRYLPPILAYDKISNEQLNLSIEIADAADGNYLVQLPPDYHHQRAYPVVMLLHSPREPAANMMKRCQEMAAYHGYILVAPLWGGKARDFTYKYSAKEHALVLDCLRDLRRRFNVDSDRVFLFGWEAGGTMAFDVGLAHPDQFAGVLPMNGSCAMFPLRCWTNGQYLPFYVIEGTNNGTNVKADRELFKDWIRSNYPSIYVEYKGRALEWYQWELPTMFEWMNKKKRHHPARELGRGALVAGQGDEFKTLREFDNKFYWVSAGGIDERNLTDAANFQKSTRPATLNGNIAIGNEAGSKDAKIWNQISVRTTGIKQVTIWLAPHMIDFTKPVAVRVNNAQYGNAKVIVPSLPTMLEEFYRSGDRQRLFFAKIDVKL